MTPYEYQKLAQRTECNHDLSKADLQGSSLAVIKLLHAAVGLTSDAGEVAAAMERHVFYRRPLDYVNLKEELGDCLWYIALACNALGDSMEDIMKANIAKLQRRYPEKFTSDLADEAARNREAERAAMESALESPTIPETCPTCGVEERVDCTMGSVEYVQALRLARGRICPHCSNPISDEVVRRLIMGIRPWAGCPNCGAAFTWNQSAKGLQRA